MTPETHRGCCPLYAKTTTNLCVESLRIIYIGVGLITYKDTKAKCRHLKELTCEGTLRKVFICLTPPPLDPKSPPYGLHTVQYLYVYTWVLTVFSQGWERGRGGDLNKREG